MNQTQDYALILHSILDGEVCSSVLVVMKVTIAAVATVMLKLAIAMVNVLVT